jgi:hypothetical protein
MFIYFFLFFSRQKSGSHVHQRQARLRLGRQRARLHGSLGQQFWNHVLPGAVYGASVESEHLAQQLYDGVRAMRQFQLFCRPVALTISDCTNCAVLLLLFFVVD